MLSAKETHYQWVHGDSVPTLDPHNKRERCETITKFDENDKDKTTFPDNIGITFDDHHNNPGQNEIIPRFAANYADTFLSATNSAVKSSESINIFNSNKKRERCETITRFMEDGEGTSSFVTNTEGSGNFYDIPTYMKRERCETITHFNREPSKIREKCETITKFMDMNEGASTSAMILHESLASSDDLILSKKRGRCETITKFIDEDEDIILDASMAYNESVGTLDLSKNQERSDEIKKLADNDHVRGIYTSKGRQERWATMTNFVEAEEDIIVAATKAYCVWAAHESFYSLDLSKSKEECETVAKLLDISGGGSSSPATKVEIASGSADDMSHTKKRKRCETITSDEGASSSKMAVHETLVSPDEWPRKKRERCETITKFVDNDEDLMSKPSTSSQWTHNESIGTLDLRKKRERCETITKYIDSDAGTSSSATNVELPTGSDNAFRPPKKREKCETVTSLSCDEGTSSFATNVDVPTENVNDMSPPKEELCKTIDNFNSNEDTLSLATNKEVCAESAIDISPPKPEECEIITTSTGNEGTSSFATNVEILTESANDMPPPKAEECETTTSSTGNEGTSSFATKVEVTAGNATDISLPKPEECETITNSTGNEESAPVSVAVDLRCGASIARGHEEINVEVNQHGPGVAPNNNQMAPPVRCPGCPLQEPIARVYRPQRPRRPDEKKRVVKPDPLPHGEIRERMLELRSIIERSLITHRPPPGQRDYQSENQLRERMAELRTIIERGMEQMEDDPDTIAAPAKRQNEALIRMRSGYDGMMLYETRVFLSDKKNKKARKKQDTTESQSKILHLSDDTDLTDEDLVQVTNKIQKRFMRARKNMCEFCHNQGMAKIYITVKHEGHEEEYNMQMMLINAARMPPATRLPRIPTRYLN